MGVKINSPCPPQWCSVVHPFLNLHITRVAPEDPVKVICDSPTFSEESIGQEPVPDDDRLISRLENELPRSEGGGVDFAMTDAPSDHSLTPNETWDDCESAYSSSANGLDDDATRFPLPMASNIYAQDDEASSAGMKSKILEFCRLFGWPDVWIERLDEWNDISQLAYGINMKSDSACRYTIAINTHNDQSVAKQIRDQACLSSFLRGRVPISETVAYDCTGNNPTKKLFILESRIPGTSVTQIYEGILPIEERRNLVLGVAETVATLQRICFDNAGIFEAACATLASEHDLRLEAVIPSTTPFWIFGDFSSKPGPRLDGGTKA